jgi:preprotein translocase subunit SecA
MFKWLGNFVDSQDKELTRLRKIVAAVNDEIEELLTEQLAALAALRTDLHTLIHRESNAGRVLPDLLRESLAEATTTVQSLTAAAPELRRVIEVGEATTRNMNVLLADSRQLAQLMAELARRTGDRQEVEANIADLSDRILVQLRAFSADRPAMEAVTSRLQNLEDRKSGRATPDEIGKMVEQTSTALEPEIAGYFRRLQDLLDGLRHATALLALLGDTSLAGGQAAEVNRGPHPLEGMRAEQAAVAGDRDTLRTAARALVDALQANDLMKHLQRQGLLLPGELLAAAGPVPSAAVENTAGGGGLFGRRKSAPAPVPLTPQQGIAAGTVRAPKDDLADLLTWQEAAAETLLALTAVALARAEAGEAPQATLAELQARFAARTDRLQGNMAVVRGQLLRARTDLWQTYQDRLEADFPEAVDPFLEALGALQERQDALLAELDAEEEAGLNPPLAVKPLHLQQVMTARDNLIEDFFRRFHADLRTAGDREQADRLRALQTEFSEADRKQEQDLLNEVLPVVFACIWDAARRAIGLRPADVQFMGGITLHEGKIAEMKTGEGKTLVATLPLSLNALTARGAHLITVNEYLAKRYSDWMGPVYALLGLTVGVILNDMTAYERVGEYKADITYGTNSEFGFDYLRDNTAPGPEQVVQRGHHFAVVDEVDNILIDEARTPLIISGPSQNTSDVHEKAAAFARHLVAKRDYEVDEKSRSAVFTDEGVERAEQFFHITNLYHPDNFMLVYGLDNALKAHALFRRDRDYVLMQDGKIISPGEKLNPKQPVEVVIVDEFTGRPMEGRRYSEGLHEAIEAKEGIRVRGESQTYATVTIQNYARMYQKLAGMTGTALTEAEEFYKIYKLEATAIPTRLPMVRQDFPDRVYKTETAKFRAVVEEIKEIHEQGRPILVGTVSIEKSEELSAMLNAEGIDHSVLNAKQHEREASLVAQAGQRGSVTIATNMAGRGTDITLGFGVAELGGLHIVGTERHESRRIDNQLRGRAGRQGDPGSSRFYVSIEDEIMRRSGVNQNIVNSRVFNALWEEDMPIEHNLISKSVETAQTKMEGYNFDLRKHLVEYDDVVNTQRDVIYKERRYVLTQGEPRTIVLDMLAETVDDLANPNRVGANPAAPPPPTPRKKGQIDAESLFAALAETFSEDVTRRMAHHLLRDHVAALIEAGNREAVGEELATIAAEGAAGRLDLVQSAIDRDLRAFYHVDDPMYEMVQQDSFDYNKLLKIMAAILPLPADLTAPDLEGMQYDEAKQYFGDLAAAEFDRQFAGRLAEVQHAAQVAAERGDAHTLAVQAGVTQELSSDTELSEAEREAGALLDLVDSAFPLSPASAAARLPIDPGSTMGAQELPRIIGVQLEQIYAEVQERLGEDFILQNAHVPLLGMVDHSIPAPVYREIEDVVGMETLEAMELQPLGQLDPEIQVLVRDAFVKHQESRWIIHVIDQLWTRHLTTMEGLRQSIGLQAYAQKDPLVEYKRNAYELFDELKAEIRQLGTRVLSLRIEPAAAPAPQPAPQPARKEAAHKEPARAPQAAVAGMIGAGAAADGAGQGNGATRGGNAPRPAQPQQLPRGKRHGKGSPAAVGATAGNKTPGRNDPCPCGSGRKYKFCHGR